MSHQLENIALLRAQTEFPENPFQRKGFTKRLRADPDWVNWYTGRNTPRFVPDAWFSEEVRVEDELSDDFKVYDRFTVVEIEDTHPCPYHKLVNYAWLDDAFHQTIRLFVFDRYGLNKREIDLNMIWCNS